jgi:hypothetical protein
MKCRPETQTSAVRRPPNHERRSQSDLSTGTGTSSFAQFATPMCERCTRTAGTNQPVRLQGQCLRWPYTAPFSLRRPRPTTPDHDRRHRLAAIDSYWHFRARRASIPRPPPLVVARSVGLDKG